VTYREVVLSARWLPVVMGGAALALLAAAAGVAAADDANGEDLVGAVAMGLAAVLLAAVAWWFRHLVVTVERERRGGGRVRCGFGPFAQTIRAVEIAGAEATPYRWMRYGGWGLRWRLPLHRGHRAWTVPFAPGGVLIHTAAGGTVYVSSARPQDLAAAIRALTDTPRDG